MTALDLARIALATVRLTRLVMADDAGQWWFKKPIDDLMGDYRKRHTTLRMAAPTARRFTPGIGGPLFDPPKIQQVEHFEEPWWWKYREGLECPHCVGFWIGAGVLLGEATLGGGWAPAPLRHLWRFATSALALNAVTAYAGIMSGYYDAGDEE